MRYSSQNNYLKLSKKRKGYDEIDSSSDFQKNPISIQDTPLGKGYSPSLKKQKFPTPSSDPSNFSEKSPILIKNLKKVKDKPRQWLLWKANSCRLDAFFTILVFSISNDNNFNINNFNSEENLKLKDTLIEIAKSNSIKVIQDLFEDFAFYREIELGEKVGEEHSITSLFNCFHKNSQFIFSLKDERSCQCGFVSIRSFNLGPLISITIENLKLSKGKVDTALFSMLGNYSCSCLECSAFFEVQRIVTDYPLFCFILLEVCDSFNSQETRDNFSLFNSIKLPLFFKLNNKKFVFSAICYFQANHYFVSVKKPNHPKISGLKSNKWVLHDGRQDNGELLESHPKLEYSMKKDKNLPYIVLYKQENS